jgi:PAS domain S-box-containing protein
MQRAFSDDHTEEPTRESEAVLRTADEGPLEEPLAGYRALLDRVPDAVVVHRGGSIVYANASAAALLGYARADDLAGVAYRELVHPDQSTSHPPLARCESPATAPLVLRRKNGEALRVESLAVPLESTPSEHEWMLVARAAERPALDEDMRAQHTAALGTLAAGVAHEINNPMTYLLVHLEHVTRRLRALVAGHGPQGFEEDIDVQTLTGFVDQLSQALDGARKVQKTVRHLMTFAQGSSESRALVDARAVLESALQMAWHYIRPRARVVKHLAEVPPVEANEARLAQAFTALLVHAAAGIPEGAGTREKVTVTTRTNDAGSVVVEIADTGEGLEPHELARVFDPYFGARAPEDGLALAVAQGTVRSLGGRIECESEKGHGTTFRVVLPAAAAWAGRARDGQKRRVVVIDDDPQVGAALSLALSSECDVMTAASAQEVLDKLAAGERFDAIVCDLTMPAPSGIDLYAQALRLAPDAVGRIVFTTTGAFTPRARAFLGSVRNVCLDKPIDEKELRGLLRRWGSG